MRILKADIDRISNARHKHQAKVAFVLIAARAVGTKLKALVRYTGYPGKFIADVVTRMQRAGLWTDQGISSAEWFDLSEDLDSAFWSHVLVGAGEARVEISEAGTHTFIPLEH